MHSPRQISSSYPILAMLKDLVQEYQSTSILERVQHRISRVKHWMTRARQLEEVDRNIARVMRFMGNAFASGKIC